MLKTIMDNLLLKKLKIIKKTPKFEVSFSFFENKKLFCKALFFLKKNQWTNLYY